MCARDAVHHKSEVAVYKLLDFIFLIIVRTAKITSFDGKLAHTASTIIAREETRMKQPCMWFILYKFTRR